MATAAIVKANSLLLSKRNERPHINHFYNNSVKFSRCFNVRNVRLNTRTLGATSKDKIVAPSIKNGEEIAAVPSSEQNLKAETLDSLHFRSDCILTRCDCFYCTHRNSKIKGKAEGETFALALFGVLGVLCIMQTIVERKKACLFKIKLRFHHLVMKLEQLYAAVSPGDEPLKEIIETDQECLVENKSMIELKEDSKLLTERLDSDDAQTVNSIDNKPVTEIEKIVDVALVQAFEAKMSSRDSQDLFGTTFESMERKIFNPMENSKEGDNYGKAVELLIAMHKVWILAIG